MNSNKVCFIIAMKYFRKANTGLNCKTYIKIYTDNINKYYNENLILIIDNNSENIDDIKELLKETKNVKILNNTSECKFEIGAYNQGIRYLIQNNLILEYEYFIFTQDNFVLNKFYDFNELSEKNIYATAINIFLSLYQTGDTLIYTDPRCINIINKINLQNQYQHFNLCWCNSFILNKSKILDYYNIVKDELITERFNGSVQSERYLSGILYYLNNYKLYSIDGSIERDILGYDCWTVDIEKDKIDRYFVKHIQQKTENTREI